MYIWKIDLLMFFSSFDLRCFQIKWSRQFGFVHVYGYMPAGPRGSSEVSDFKRCIASCRLAFFALILIAKVKGAEAWGCIYANCSRFWLYHLDVWSWFSMAKNQKYTIDHRKKILAPYSAKRFLASSKLKFFAWWASPAAFTWPWFIEIGNPWHDTPLGPWIDFTHI